MNKIRRPVMVVLLDSHEVTKCNVAEDDDDENEGEEDDGDKRNLAELGNISVQAHWERTEKGQNDDYELTTTHSMCRWQFRQPHHQL